MTEVSGDAAGRSPQEFERVLAAASTAQATFEEEHLPLLKRIQRFLHSYPTVVPFVVLLMGVALGLTVNFPRFATANNMSTILLQVTIIGILGIAQTLIILTAGIDLSVGVIMVISSVVMGRLGVIDGLPLIIAFPAGLLCGVVFGYLNGTLVTRLKMPPFIVTLGTLSIIGALNTWYSQSETVRSQDLADKAPFLQLMGYPIEIGGARIILGTLLLVVLAVVVWYLLNRTAFGRHVYATGDDREAAHLPGINTDRVLLSVYVLAGLISSIAGWVLIGRVGAISPTSGAGRQSRQHHRRRHRRHQSVRRARLDRRHADRRADRRRLPLRPFRSPGSTCSGRSSQSAF